GGDERLRAALDRGGKRFGTRNELLRLLARQRDVLLDATATATAAAPGRLHFGEIGFDRQPRLGVVVALSGRSGVLDLDALQRGRVDARYRLRAREARQRIAGQEGRLGDVGRRRFGSRRLGGRRRHGGCRNRP